MNAPRYQRRKDDRPAEITAAALDAFAENGYANTRVDDVARRAGVSKGLLYVYFRTKEELFKAVVRSVVLPRFDALTAEIDDETQSAEEFLRGPLATFLKRVPGSPVSIVVRLMLTEGARHPDLVRFYWDHVASRGLALIQRLVERGVASGEFRETRLADYPQLVVAPVLVAVLFELLFRDQPLDVDGLVDTQIDMIVGHLRADRGETP